MKDKEPRNEWAEELNEHYLQQEKIIMTDKLTNKSWKKLKRGLMPFDTGYPLLPRIPWLVRLLFKSFTREYDVFAPKYQELLHEVETSRTIESSTIKINDRQTNK